MSRRRGRLKRGGTGSDTPKESRRATADARPPTDSPTASAARRRALPLFIVAALAAAGVVAAVLAMRERAPSTGDVGPQPSLVAPPDDAPDAPIDPRGFVIPESLDAAQRDAARRAVDLHARALDALVAGRGDEFLALATDALRAYNEARWIFAELGQLHHAWLVERFNRGDVLARKHCEEWLARHPDAARHVELLGLMAYRDGDLATAVQQFATYLEMRPRSLRTARRLASVAAELGDRERALAAVQRALELIGFPDRADLRHPEVDATLRVALETSHRFLDYERLGAIARALLERSPDDVDARMALGAASQQTGRLEEAEQLYRAVLASGRASPENTEDVRLQLAITLLKRERPREALEELVGLLESSPYVGAAYFQLGQCLNRLRRFEAARMMVQRSRGLAAADREMRRYRMQLDAGDPAWAERTRARALSLQHRYAEAEAALRGSGAKKESAATPPAQRVYLAELLVETLQATAAREVLRELEGTLGARHADIVGWRALADAACGRAADAVAPLVRLCDEMGLGAVWGPRLGRLLLEELARPAEAAVRLAKVLETTPDPASRVLLGRALVESGDAARALATLAAIAAGQPEFAREHGAVWLTRARIALGRDLPLAAATLARLRPSARHLAAYELAVAEWLSTGGSPADIGLEGDPSELEAAARARAGELTALGAALRDLTARAACATEIAAAVAALLDAARNRLAAGDDAAAERFTRLAVAREPASADGWRLLVALLDAPADMFLRAEAARRLRALDASAPPPASVAAIVEALLAARDGEDGR